MSDAGDGNPAPRSPVGAAGAWVAGNSGTQEGDSNVAGAAAIAVAAGALVQAEREQVGGPHGALESESSDDESEMELGEEVEGDVIGPPVPLLGARQLPAGGFHFIFLELVHSLLYRIYYNHHILMRPVSGQVLVQPGPQGGLRVPQFPVPLALEVPREGAVAQEPEGMDDEDAAQEPEGQAQEPAQEAAAQEGEEQVPGSGRPLAREGPWRGGQPLSQMGDGPSGPTAQPPSLE